MFVFWIFVGAGTVTGSAKLTQGGKMNLTHPAKWLLRCGGTDAEGGGSDGVGVLRKHGASIRELARMTGHSRNTVRRYLRRDVGTPQAGWEARWEAR